MSPLKVADATNIYLVRHGETLWNQQKRMQGRRNSPLTERGQEQARETRRALENVALDCAHASPLGRAWETLDIIIAGRDIPVVASPALREIDLGPWEGLTQPENQKSHPEQFAAFWSQPDRFHLQGAETFQQLQDRVVKELMRILDTERGKNVLVVAHMMVIKVALAWFTSMPLYRLPEIDDPANGEVIVLSASGGEFHTGRLPIA